MPLVETTCCAAWRPQGWSVTDMGVAKEGFSYKTSGTTGRKAPEQAGGRCQGRKVDVLGLGIVILEFL